MRDSDAGTGEQNPKVVEWDESQWWAAGFLAVLVCVFATLAWVLLGVFTAHASPRVNLFFLSFLATLPVAMMPWLKVGIISLAGAVLEVGWGVGSHGFWEKNYDPETIPFSLAKLVGAPFITLAAMGVGSLILPAELEFFVPGIPLSPFSGAVALLLGYHSADLLDLVHDKMTRLLGKTPKPMKGKPLRKAISVPLDLLAGNAAAAAHVGERAQDLVKPLAERGVTTTADLLAYDDEALDALATDARLPPERLRRLRAVADALARSGTLERALAQVAPSRNVPLDAPPKTPESPPLPRGPL